MNMKLILGTVGAVILTSAAPASAQPTEIDINVGMIDSGDICGASYDLGDGKKLEFRINAKKLYVDVAVQNLPAEIVDKGLDKDNVPITVIFDDYYKSTADKGLYRSGFTRRVQGYWEDNNKGLEVLDHLEVMETASVEFDGYRFGPATQKPPSFGYIIIKNCLKSKGVKID